MKSTANTDASGDTDASVVNILNDGLYDDVVHYKVDNIASLSDVIDLGPIDIAHLSDLAVKLLHLKKVEGILKKVFDQIFEALDEHCMLRRGYNHALPSVTVHHLTRLGEMQQSITLPDIHYFCNFKKKSNKAQS